MDSEDLVGMDRLARSFARQIARMQSPCMIAVHGAPGSAKRDFLKSLSGLVTDPRALGLTPGRELYPEVVWFDAWSYAKQGNVLAGLVARVARMGPGGAAMQERSRDVIAQLNRLDLSDANPESPGPALTDGEMEPVDRLQRGFAGVVQSVRAGRPGKLIVCVEGLDRLRQTCAGRSLMASVWCWAAQRWRSGGDRWSGKDGRSTRRGRPAGFQHRPSVDGPV